MKNVKIISVLLILAMLLTACGSKNSNVIMNGIGDDTAGISATTSATSEKPTGSSGTTEAVKPSGSGTGTSTDGTETEVGSSSSDDAISDEESSPSDSEPRATSAPAAMATAAPVFGDSVSSEAATESTTDESGPFVPTGDGDAKVLTEDFAMSEGDSLGGTDFSAPDSTTSSLAEGDIATDDMIIEEPVIIPEWNAVMAGQLTAGEWNDNKNWAFFQNLMRDQGQWSIYQDNWGISPVNRIAVTINATSGSVVQNKKVILLSEQGTTLWSAVTDHTGTAYLYYKIFDGQYELPANLVIEGAVSGTAITTEDLISGYKTVTIESAEVKQKALDLMLVFDTTGSMGDELIYLQSELEDVVNQVKQQNSNIPIRLSVNFYRDDGDVYVVHDYDFTDDIASAISALKEQYADGGGDYEEAVERALNNAINGHEWNEDSVKLLFIILDAPPHQSVEISDSLKESIQAAAAKGIRVIPVASSGVDANTEFLLRTLSATTGGTYTFLTSDSGIGGEHLEPTIGEYVVEKLNALLVRVIGEYLQ